MAVGNLPQTFLPITKDVSGSIQRGRQGGPHVLREEDSWPVTCPGLQPLTLGLEAGSQTRPVLGLAPGPPLLPQPSSGWSWPRAHAHPVVCP